MGIPRKDIIGPAFQGTGQELVVCGIINDPVGSIAVLGDQGFSEYQLEEPLDVLFIRVEPLLDPWIMHDPVDLFDDINGGHQDKIQVDPVVLEGGRNRIIAEQA